ncbi:MAG: DNA cytosine methyltransferase [Rhodococcus sp.]|nr:DNA cytosine methyltransferase [Rhodococcus sp. (in: high G+C Gram-positive bacteria)]
MILTASDFFSGAGGSSEGLEQAGYRVEIAASEVHRYKTVIVENVPEFTGWTLYQWWLDGMRALGYREQTVILDAADFGMPQRRIRYFAVFTRNDLPLPDLDYLPTPLEPASTILDDNLGKPVTRRLYVTPQIEQILEKDVPHLVTYRRNAKARRADQNPLATITAGGNHHGIATLTDDGPRFRMLTNRECARAQGFPDTYRFVGTTAEVKKMVGNAVPVGVARWLGEQVAESLTTRQEPAA